MEKQDLRVKKTKQNIETALLKLLDSNPLEKITVTELARVAEINKGTFYLHYTDIYDLYNQILLKYMLKPVEEGDYFKDFFDDPAGFMEKFNKALMDNLPVINRIIQNKKERVDYNYFVNCVCDKIYETGRIPRTASNNLKLMAVFGSITMINNQYGGKYSEQTKDMIGAMIRDFFGN